MGDLRNATPGDLIADKYVLRQLLGEGGMGRVFLARHELTGRAVALKLVPAQDGVTRERLLREARSMGMLAHPNVVGVLDMGEWADGVYIAMEYLHGVTLREYIARGVLTPEEGIGLLLPTCSGVAACHEAAILHRDLKPDNVFVCTNSDGEPLTTVLLDFGVAKILDETLGPSSLTDSGSVVGTPKYMAPEQLGDGQPLDERTDVYALGLILYEALAGRLPYEGPTLRKSVLAILKGDYTPLHSVQPTVPKALSDIVMKALSPDVEDRHASVAEFATELEPFSDGETWAPPLDVHTMNARGDSWTPPPMPLSSRPETRSSVEAADTVHASPDPAQLARALATTRALPPQVLDADPTQTPNGTERSTADSPLPSAPRRPWLAAAITALVLVGGWYALQSPWAARDAAGAGESALHVLERAPAAISETDAPPGAAATAMPPEVPEAQGATEASVDAGAGTESTRSVVSAEAPTSAPASARPPTPSVAQRPQSAKPAQRPAKTTSARRPVKTTPAQPPAAIPPATPVEPAKPAPYPPTDNRDPWAE